MSSCSLGHEDSFKNGEKRLVVVEGIEVGVFRLDGQFFAWRNVCPHQGGPVCQGQIFRRVIDAVDDARQVHGRQYHDSDVNIVCPWHGAEFDIRTGRHAGTDRLRLSLIDIEVRDGKVYIHVDAANK